MIGRCVMQMLKGHKICAIVSDVLLMYGLVAVVVGVELLFMFVLSLGR